MWKQIAYHYKLALRIIAGLVVFFILVTLLIKFEKDSAQSSIVDYPNAVWYAVVTVTGVGYGDLYPATTYGRGIGYIFVLVSVGVYILFISKIVSFMGRLKENQKLGYLGTSFSDHTIIVGWNEITRNVTDQLIGVHKKTVIISDQTNEIDTIHERYHTHKNFVFALHADYSNYEALSKANIEKASVIFLNFNNDMDKLVYILNAKKQYENKDYVVILENSELRNAFISAGAIYIVAKNEIASKMLASYIFEPDVAEYSEDIISYAKHDLDYDIKQYRVTSSNPYKGQEYPEVFLDIKKRFNIILIGISKCDNTGKRTLIKNPHESLKIEAGDYLIVIVSGQSSKRLEEIFNVYEGV